MDRGNRNVPVSGFRLSSASPPQTPSRILGGTPLFFDTHTRRGLARSVALQVQSLTQLLDRFTQELALSSLVQKKPRNSVHP